MVLVKTRRSHVYVLLHSEYSIPNMKACRQALVNCRKCRKKHSSKVNRLSGWSKWATTS